MSTENVDIWPSWQRLTKVVTELDSLADELSGVINDELRDQLLKAAHVLDCVSRGVVVPL